MPSPTASSRSSPVTPANLLRVDALSFGQKWGGATGQAASLSFSFPWTTTSTADFFGSRGNGSYSSLNENTASYHYGLDAVQQNAARSALQSWSALANISFTEVTESSATVGDIRVAWTSAKDTTSSGTGAWGWASYPNSTWPSAGDIWIETLNSGNTNPNWAEGGYNLQALIHEVGHALGLKHTFEGSTVLSLAQDTRQFSVMSYTDAPNDLFVAVTRNADGTASWRSYYVYSDTPMLFDIAAIQYLYGANTQYHAGSDIYTFDPATPFFRTIWDGGGNDTISVANFTAGCTIDLQAGHFSSITIKADSTAGYTWASPPPVASYDGTNNLAIAYGCVIENAVGGSGNDLLIGNAADNLLDGGAGNNTLVGGEGTDTAIFHSKFADVKINFLASENAYQITSLTGAIDKIAGIELLRFDDQSITLAGYLGISTPASGVPAVPNDLKIVSTTPLAGATAVNAKTDLVLDFNRAIQRGSGNLNLLKWDGATSTLVESFDVANSSRLKIVDTRITLDPSSDLDGNAKYSLVWEAGSLLDLSGRSYQASLPYEFTTAASPPAALSYVIRGPISLKEGELATFTVTISSAPSAATTVYFSTLAGTASTGAGDYAGFSDRALTFTPGGPTSQTVTVQTLSDTLVEGNETFRAVVYTNIGDFGSAIYLATSNTVTLIDLSPPETIPPKVLSFTPVNSPLSGIETSANLVLSFDESIVRGSGSIALVDADGMLVASYDVATSGMLSISGNSLTINPANDLRFGTSYTIEIGANAIKDLSGNSYLTGTSYRFTTRDLPTPITGTSANDTLQNRAGSDTIDGGAGTDTLRYAGNRSAYSLIKTTDGWSVSNLSGTDGVDNLRNIERLAFADTSIALDGNGVAGQVYRLYQAAFNRIPDAGGLGYWISQLDKGLSLRAVAAGFVSSSEFTAVYGANPVAAQTVDQLYQNVLHRAGDAGGVSFWRDVLEQNRDSLAGVLTGFSESNENQVALTGILNNGFAFTPYG